MIIIKKTTHQKHQTNDSQTDQLLQNFLYSKVLKIFRCYPLGVILKSGDSFTWV